VGRGRLKDAAWTAVRVGVWLVWGFGTLAWLAGCAAEPAADSDGVPSYELRRDAPVNPTNADLQGRPLPDVGLVTSTGVAVRTSDLRGRPALLNVWYSTCEPCRREMPLLADAHRTWGAAVDVVGINPQDDDATAARFVATYGVGYDTWFDRDGAFLRATGIATAPVTLAVDAAGTVVDQAAGELDAARLERLLAALGVLP
jgi:thiol-disulfide isomerase/thioredoxin